MLLKFGCSTPPPSSSALSMRLTDLCGKHSYTKWLVPHICAMRSRSARLKPMWRALGPLFAGVLIATVGIAFCFFANALSFLVVVVFLSYMRPEEFHREVARAEGPSDILSGLRYVASMPT